jgi:hypothetical protein
MNALILRADYSNTVMSLNPVAYWPLNERPRGGVPINHATVQVTNAPDCEAFYSADIVSGVAGAIVAETNSAVTLNGSTAYVMVPFQPVLRLAPPFSIEGWFKPASASPACVCSCGGFGRKRSGWAVYYDPFHGWNFRVHDQNSAAASISIEGGDTSTGIWHHVVAAHDGTNGCLYVDGIRAAGPTLAKDFTPNQFGAFTIGIRSDNVFPFEGSVDEVALYTNTLPDSVIEGHYRNATNCSPSESYASLVRKEHPLLYFRMDETAAPPIAGSMSSTPSPSDPALITANPRIQERAIALNYGSFGADVNGTYVSGARPGSPGPPFPGFGPESFACRFDATFGGYVDCTSDPRLNIIGPMTAIAWIKASLAGNRFQTFLGRSDYSWRADVDWQGLIRWADGKDNPDAVGVAQVNNGRWHFFAGVYDGGTNYVYVDGQLEGTSIAWSRVSGKDCQSLIGSVPDYLADRQFQGSIAQVSIFTNALSAQDILRIYQSAEPGPPSSK